MPRWLIIVGSAVALLLAGAWIWSFATKTGVLISASDYMVSDFQDGDFDPTATDTPIGKLCEYVSYNGVHSLILLDRNEEDAVQSLRRRDARLDTRLEYVSFVESRSEAKCPATDRVPG